MEANKKVTCSISHSLNGSERRENVGCQTDDETLEPQPQPSLDLDSQYTTGFEGHHFVSSLPELSRFPQTSVHFHGFQSTSVSTDETLPLEEKRRNEGDTTGLVFDASTSTHYFLGNEITAVNTGHGHAGKQCQLENGMGGNADEDSAGTSSSSNIDCLENRKKWVMEQMVPTMPNEIFVFRTEEMQRGTDRRVNFGYKQELYKNQEKPKLRPRLLIVDNEDEPEEVFEFHMRAMEKRISRDNVEALNILKTLQETPSSASILIEFDNRERYYRRKLLIAWKAAQAMTRTKKIPFPTVIPVAATSTLRKRLTRLERIRRYFVKFFGCRARLYVDEVLTQKSIEKFNMKDKHMKNIHILPGFGLQRRMRLFGTQQLPNMIDYDDTFVHR